MISNTIEKNNKENNFPFEIAIKFRGIGEENL